MSRIEKLSIQGVRSFGPGAREAICFNTPLTLIVGYNGSGKTTIIECLKYATTGDLPPNSKGGAFIHDPKLCGEKEVLAQVKLAFKSTGSARFVVTRSLQLTVKKTTRSQKTLEGSLVWNNNGERTTVSSKVADLDEVVPQELGVSRAILDSVIFCHQDESLWPMSEPLALKRRFDEIFEAMRYTKAIDNIKVLRKKQGEKLAQLKIFEDQDRQNKEKGDKAEARSKALNNEIEELRGQVTSFTEKMEGLQERSKEKHEQANSFLSIVNDLSNKRDQLEYREETVEELKATLEEIQEPDEWLENILSQYEEKADQYQGQLDENRQAYNGLQGELGSSRKSLQGKLAEQGKHQSDKEKYERQLQTRVDLIQDTARLHSIRGFDGDITDAQVKAFNERLMKLLNDKKRELEAAKKARAEEYDTAAALITDLEGKRASSMQDRVSSLDRINTIERRIKVLLGQIKSLNIDENAITLLGLQRQELEDRLQKETRKLDDAKWDEQLQEENSRLVQLESENSSLSSELVECTRLAAERAQLDLRRKEQTDRQKRLDTLTNTWKDKLSGVVEDDWTPETLDKQFLQIMTAHNRVLEDNHRRRDGTSREVERLEYKLTSARKDRSKRSAEAAASRKKVYDAIALNSETPNVENYEQEVEDLRLEIQGYEKDIALFGALEDYYTQCSNMLEKQNKCKLCERGFGEQTEVKTKLKHKIQKLLNPAQKAEIQADLDAARPFLDTLEGVRQDFETYKRISAEIPTLDADIKSIESQRATQLRNLEDKDQVVKDAEDRLRDLESMNKTVVNISQLARDIADGQGHISRLEAQQRSFAGSRSAEEIHELQTTIGDQIRSVKQKISRFTSERQHSRDVVSTLELEKSELTNKMNSAEGQLERKQDLEGQVQSLREDSAHQREIIQQADAKIKTLEPEIAKARVIREETVSSHRAKEQKLTDERDNFASSASELRMVDADIQGYVNRGAASEMAANQRAIKQLEKTIERIEREVADVTKQTNQLREEMANSDRRKKNICDNINYRKNLRILETLRADIEDLESRNATEDYDRLLREAKKYENEYSVILAERSSIMGSMKTKDEELSRVLEEWNMDYKNADKKYRESHIKVETTKAAIEDLGKFAVALDKAIMEYHKRKMEDVNRIAGELWQSTYQGTDIDTIMIKSDAESSNTRRNYNYRVCMVKQDTDMDMRGRCSAGQKVLASIIIRLALAESFGVNCGLIALDEPTTNLDSDNIRSLAMSLHSIIKARQQQSNFQLIVITHDEEFLRYMRCGDFCDTFFRVSRNDRQNSVIGVESISKVSE
ncbi:DNA repair protein RAD50 [Zalerion maritima]|uniref:DNA repair protein RAD50 n=1 Tax=Zalerion maritima TaxID=339359 RepID=A0AAD5RUL1_9PEZI|nr:DNA repair protein RAD50 [Zalerion maritima]